MVEKFQNTSRNEIVKSRLKENYSVWGSATPPPVLSLLDAEEVFTFIYQYNDYTYEEWEWWTPKMLTLASQRNGWCAACCTPRLTATESFGACGHNIYFGNQVIIPSKVLRSTLKSTCTEL
jgi:hypothetical protein